MPPRTKSIQELRKELEAKEKKVKRLRSQRKKLVTQLQSIDKQISALGGEIPAAPTQRKRRRKKVAKRKIRRTRKVGKRGRKAKTVTKAKKVGRPRRARKRATGKPLVKYLQQVLAKAKGGMRARDIVGAVQKAGYKSSSKDFYGIIAATLRERDEFKRLGRGIYTTA